MTSGPRYADLIAPFREAAARGEDPPPEVYTVEPAGERAEPLEVVALMTSLRREMQVYAFDPGFDPRRALRTEKERRISLTNYLNFAAAGPRQSAGRGGQARALSVWSVGAAQPTDTRVHLQSEHIVAAHDFRVHNPAAAALRVEMAYRQHALFWLDDGAVLLGQVFNLDHVLMRAEETSFFFSVCQPVFYGATAGTPWGRGLPFLALNRRYVVAKKQAQNVEELEAYLAAEPSLQPQGFAPAQLTAWDRLPEDVRRAAERGAGRAGDAHS